ncbi:hypothetical protein L6452_19535 [Arctium lappa]|uniref:Uncharacterized protein n=1 Tax=Arctium lappa TaxID=4217 RepID=A0ACB9B8U9_ARCLA|nr:hypothetical protein L6452_19535 [Arctium lappa]
MLCAGSVRAKNTMNIMLTNLDDSGKVRVKPRDPRRALHSKSLQNPACTGPPKFCENERATCTTRPPSEWDWAVHLKTLLRSPSNHKTLGDVEQYFRRFDDQQRVAIQRERSKRMEEQKKMFANHKLCLVLDLYHTLLNSAKDEMLKKKEEQDREKPHRHPFRSPRMGMWTKLWPGIWNFLEKASKLYELHLYTMENKLYATEMAKVLDPKGVIFNGHVILRDDDGDNVDGNPKTNDLEGVLGMESVVVIIDDSIRVWPHNKLNLNS